VVEGLTREDKRLGQRNKVTHCVDNNDTVKKNKKTRKDIYLKEFDDWWNVEEPDWNCSLSKKIAIQNDVGCCSLVAK
jgi:hypothetical protein